MPGALLLGLALAQAMSGRPADAAQFARIRKALAEPPAIAAVAAPQRDGLVFRPNTFSTCLRTMPGPLSTTVTR